MNYITEYLKKGGIREFIMDELKLPESYSDWDLPEWLGNHLVERYMNKFYGYNILCNHFEDKDMYGFGVTKDGKPIKELQLISFDKDEGYKKIINSLLEWHIKTKK